MFNYVKFQDALGNLPPQKREDLTASAQQFLRQIAFRQIHKVCKDLILCFKLLDELWNTKRNMIVT